jgi:hypothetical protein
MPIEFLGMGGTNDRSETQAATAQATGENFSAAAAPAAGAR